MIIDHGTTFSDIKRMLDSFSSAAFPNILFHVVYRGRKNSQQPRGGYIVELRGYANSGEFGTCPYVLFGTGFSDSLMEAQNQALFAADPLGFDGEKFDNLSYQEKLDEEIDRDLEDARDRTCMECGVKGDCKCSLSKSTSRLFR